MDKRHLVHSLFDNNLPQEVLEEEVSINSNKEPAVKRAVEDLSNYGFVQTSTDQILALIEENKTLRSELGNLKRQTKNQLLRESNMHTVYRKQLAEEKKKQQKLKKNLKVRDTELYEKRKQLENACRLLDNTKKDRDQLGDKLNVVGARLTKMNQSIDRLNGERQRAIGQKHSQSGDLVKLAEKVRLYSEDRAGLKRSIQRLNIDKQSLTNQIYSLSSTITVQKQHMQKLHDSLQNLKVSKK